MKPEDSGQHEQSGLVAIVTDSTTYLPPELIESLQCRRSASTWGGRAICAARRSTRPRRLLLAPGRVAAAADDLAAVDRRLHRCLPTACPSGQGRCLGTHRRGALGHLRERPSSRVDARRGGPRRACVVHDAQSGAGGLGCLVVVAARLATEGEDAEAIVAGISAARGASISGSASTRSSTCAAVVESARRGRRSGRP